jgi:HK97 gp10 family phage protein
MRGAYLTVKTTLTGFTKLKKLPGKKVRINDLMRTAVLVAANQVANDARRAVAGGPKGGKAYKKYNPKRDHVASAPGEAPATDLGQLLASIRAFAPGNKHLHAFVIAEAFYAKWLEFGTGNILPRPFMGPAFEKNKPWIRQLLKDAYHKGMHGGN